ncbi:non-ribosomal peptide synthetase, partial [Methanobrevibacter sp.]
YMTTQVAKWFMESIDETSLDVLVTGGEKLGEFNSPKGYSLIDSYGPTESFGFVDSMYHCEKLHYSSDGFANFNVRFYVLDNELRRVPVGAVGELYIAGYQLADGYLNRDEETSKVFIDNPFDDEEGYSVLYRTGDMVRFLPDGTLGVVGRRDGQVKVRGNRVELSEVEVVIRELDCVDDVTVQTIQNGGNYELVAYVVSSELDDDELRNIVQNHVSICKPDYMVPSFVVKLDVVPLTVNGKVDRRALPDVDVGSLSVEYVAPSSEIEKVIVSAFEKVFNREHIGVYDEFTRLGGDSMISIKLTSLLAKHDINIGSNIIFKAETPYNIAKFIDNDENDYGFVVEVDSSGNTIYKRYK